MAFSKSVKSMNSVVRPPIVWKSLGSLPTGSFGPSVTGNQRAKPVAFAMQAIQKQNDSQDRDSASPVYYLAMVPQLLKPPFSASLKGPVKDISSYGVSGNGCVSTNISL